MGPGASSWLISAGEQGRAGWRWERGGGGREAKFRRGAKRAEGMHVCKWIRVHF